MCEITKTLSVPADGKSTDFRLTKPDNFSGAALLRIRAFIDSGISSPTAGHGKRRLDLQPRVPEVHVCEKSRDSISPCSTQGLLHNAFGYEIEE